MSDKRTHVVIIGAGPAGLSAAIYAARASMDTLVLGCPPKIAGDYDIDNYFGFTETISGRELMERGRAQAERFGAEISCDKVMKVVMAEDGSFEIKTEAGKILADAVILATGVSRVRPGVNNLSDYEGKGVSYCVSCDGFFYRGKKVMVLGEGIYAANQALELTTYTPHVAVVTQGKEPTMRPKDLEALKAANIAVVEKKIVSLSGELLESAIYEDGSEEAVDGLFVAMGEASSLDFAYSLGLERSGVFIVADGEQRTNIPGVFAAGDCTGGFLQIAVAVGEGAVAAKGAIAHAKARKKDRGE